MFAVRWKEILRFLRLQQRHDSHPVSIDLICIIKSKMLYLKAVRINSSSTYILYSLGPRDSGGQVTRRSNFSLRTFHRPLFTLAWEQKKKNI